MLGRRDCLDWYRENISSATVFSVQLFFGLIVSLLFTKSVLILQLNPLKAAYGLSPSDVQEHTA